MNSATSWFFEKAVAKVLSNFLARSTQTNHQQPATFIEEVNTTLKI